MRDYVPSVGDQYALLVRSCCLHCRERQTLMLLMYVLFFFANLAYMTQPWVVGQLIDGLHKGGPEVLRQSCFWLALYVGSMVAFWVFQGPGRVVERNLALHIRTNFNLHYYDIISRLPLRWHQDRHSGSTVNRIQKAATALFEFAGNQFLFLETILRCIFVFVAIAFVDWRVSVALLVGTILVF